MNSVPPDRPKNMISSGLLEQHRLARAEILFYAKSNFIYGESVLFHRFRAKGIVYKDGM